MKTINRTLTVDIDMDEAGCSVTVTDNESGSYTTIDVMVSPDEHPEFDEQIGNEIYSWISLMNDEFEMED